MNLLKNAMVVVTFGFVPLFFSSAFTSDHTCPNVEGKFKQTYPSTTAAELQISTHMLGDDKVYNLVMPSVNGPVWNWKLIASGHPQPKDLGALYKDVYEVAQCKDRQLYVKTYGKLIDGNKIISFSQQWFIYRNTMGRLMWQINYTDETLQEPKISIFGYDELN
ncbi:MAG: hypothetical protein SGJ18_15620 [Pseudomonadota bacterium]|nr:hypothetical protein [Pseudomonadota bacterium]